MASSSRGRDGPKAVLTARGLTPSSIFVRIRPLAAAGSGSGHTDGEAVSKKLASFDEERVTMQDDDLRQKKTYEVTNVIAPDVDQEGTFKATCPELLEAFHTDMNVLFFAYGQTGSGKTHTMLGEVESLSSAEPVAGWGIFPRIVHATLERMKQRRASGRPSVLLASAVEFIYGCAFDLNSRYRDAKTEVTIDRDANVLGTRSKEVKSIPGLRKWIHRMYANRTTAKTNMNDASSRSHCAFVLTLHQIREDGTYAKTSFAMVDMAGSERCAKTGGERVNGLAATKEISEMMAAGTPELISIGAQGTLINYEISMITTEVLRAGEAHRMGRPYKAAKESSTAASFFFCACCDGRARLGACVNISQSPQHGFETWFSLNYAESLTSLHVPLVKVKSVPLDQSLKTAAAAAEEAKEAFEKMGPPQGPKQHRIYCLASGEVTHTAETLAFLKRLADEMEGNAPDDGSDVSDAPWESPLAPSRRKHDVEAPQKSALEMGKVNDNFVVFIRIRPLVEREIKAGATNSFDVADVENFPRDPPPQRITALNAADVDSSSFVFNRVFQDSCGQAEVYRESVQPYVADFLGGTNVTIFAYGQTGTGKTHTIAGPAGDPGIIGQSLLDIFAGLPATGKHLYYEYVQLYMDAFKDLLVADSTAQLKLVEGKAGGMFLQGASSRQAASADAVLQGVAAGAARRATRAQDMNAVSSRSHAILILRLVSPDAPDEPGHTLFIVDLAGSERSDRSGVTGKGFEEATSINQSLTALGRVVLALIESQRFVPYNGHPLTSLLRGGLGGNSKTALIACITQAGDSQGESVNTLRFAMQASHVKNKVLRSDAKAQAAQDAAEIANKGHVPDFQNGKATLPLLRGELEVWGSWDESEEAASRTVLLLGELNTDPQELQELIAALAAKGCRVVAPKLPGTRQAHLDEDIVVLLAIVDWLGWGKPMIYGRDWGAIRALKFRIAHPKRTRPPVLEEHVTKFKTEKAAKEMETRDMMRACGMGSFLWIFDSAFPTGGDYKPGKNMEGFKGKVTLLWPFNNRGKPDPRQKGWNAKAVAGFAKALRTKAIDSFQMSDADVAEYIVAGLAS